ncbi:hypothetical protein GCM10010919_33430 [Alishewanella longhuensis]|uniref:CBS domain-containing protein n=1 Tax=Alishewanella longhuensis TaxID=1091037 RepID=A0ABQ3L4S9_9ALTE|nr:hypothetical protein GCM10010919_33430 [Alishewanella longhuensis]
MGPNSAVASVWQLLRKHKVSILPVTDTKQQLLGVVSTIPVLNTQQQLVGIITHSDLITALFNSKLA